MFEFFVSHQQFSKSIEPSVTSPDYPPTRFFIWIAFFAQGFTLSIYDMRDVPVGQNDLHGVCALMARVSAQVLAAVLFGHGAFDHA